MRRKLLFERNTNGLRDHALHKAQSARERVEAAIQDMLRHQKPIGFNGVARAAGVSRSYLYTQAEIRCRIEGLRQQQGRARALAVSGGRQEQPRTEKSKAVLREGQTLRIRALEAEIQLLKAEALAFYGKLYESV